MHHVAPSPPQHSIIAHSYPRPRTRCSHTGLINGAESHTPCDRVCGGRFLVAGYACGHMHDTRAAPSGAWHIHHTRMANREW